jgi:hypothetical protein
VRQQYASLQVLLSGVDAEDDHEAQERQRLQALSQELGLTGQVRFITHSRRIIWYSIMLRLMSL